MLNIFYFATNKKYESEAKIIILYMVIKKLIMIVSFNLYVTWVFRMCDFMLFFNILKEEDSWILLGVEFQIDISLFLVEKLQ